MGARTSASTRCTCARDPTRDVQSRRGAEPWCAALERRRARLHDAGRVCRRRELALDARRAAELGRRRRCLRATTPPRQRDTPGALLPRLPLQVEPACAASGGPRSAHVRGDAVLERQLRDPKGRLERVPVRRRRAHERRPGMVAPRSHRRVQDRVRAARGSAPLARVHHRVRVPPLLRLGSVRRPRVRCRRHRAPLFAERRAATPAERSPGSGTLVSAAGSRTRRSTNRRSISVSSSASDIAVSRPRSNDA